MAYRWFFRIIRAIWIRHIFIGDANCNVSNRDTSRDVGYYRSLMCMGEPTMAVDIRSQDTAYIDAKYK